MNGLRDIGRKKINIFCYRGQLWTYTGGNIRLDVKVQLAIQLPVLPELTDINHTCIMDLGEEGSSPWGGQSLGIVLLQMSI